MRIEISEDLKEKLKSLDNNVVKLLFCNNKKEFLAPNPVVIIKSYVDESGNNNDGYVTIIKEDNRSANMKLSRIFKHVFNKDFYSNLLSSDIEQANNDFVSLCATHVFKVVSNVRLFYEESSYYGYGTSIQDDRTGTLWKSCMRNNMHNCGQFFECNPSIKLLVKLKNDKVVGRALLWQRVLCNDTGKEFDFMDRIYTVYDHDVKAFKDWAQDNGYCRKEFQTYEDLVDFIDEKGSHFKVRNASVDIKNYDPYDYTDERGIPYFDTFMYVNNNNTLSNYINKHSAFEARDPEGHKTILETADYKKSGVYMNTQFMRYIDSTNRWVLENESVWVPSASCYEEIENVTHLDGEAYRTKDIKFSNIYKKDIPIINGAFYCEASESWLLSKDGVHVGDRFIWKEAARWSHAQQCYIEGIKSQNIHFLANKTNDVIEKNLYVELRKKYINFRITTEFIHDILNFSFGKVIPFNTEMALNKHARHLFFPPLFFLRGLQDLHNCSPSFFDKCYKRESFDNSDYHKESFREDLGWIKKSSEIIDKNNTILYLFMDLANNRGFQVENADELYKESNNILIK